MEHKFMELQEHKFKHSFLDSINPICNCELNTELTLHYLIHCTTYNTERHTLMSPLRNIDNNHLDFTEPIFKTLLFGSNYFDVNTDTNISNATIEYVLSAKDLTNRIFNEFSESCCNKVINKTWSDLYVFDYSTINILDLLF